MQEIDSVQVHWKLSEWYRGKYNKKSQHKNNGLCRTNAVAVNAEEERGYH